MRDTCVAVLVVSSCAKVKKIHHLCTSLPSLISHFGGYSFGFQQLAFCLQDANLSYVEVEKASKRASMETTQNVLNSLSVQIIPLSKMRYFERYNRFFYGSNSNPGLVKVETLSSL